jgi:enoyl-CoA hydratase/carnithine racemase
VIAAVDGVAIGVGTTMLFHCDLVYATPASTFATPFLSLGLIPEAGSSLLMPRRMGYARAFEMLALGETFSAEQAVQAGFVNKIAAPDQIEETALEASRRLASLPPEALAMTRTLMRGNPVEILQQTDKEVIAFRERLASPEALEAFTAFFEKRSPNFRKPV